MTSLSKVCRTAAFIAGISLISAVSVASAHPEGAEPPAFGKPGAFPPPPGFPPPMPALYQASLQATDPVQAVNKLVANVPQGNGKTYEVSISVREIPPMPQPEPHAPNAAK
ncbi:hypothetical protein [Dickeya fangzhongdai]|uniref:hypothetical protein n=1 Tax=Dickeya fangzhongdai TaxID=1778540 RepID=UPI0004F7D47E|nr:hypothetical protein [Dickeya fangzhongdai]AIR71021.1 hypothetical protein LH89_18080 [Dickeya fangzhongdai]KGT97954.1 hypothetical protein NM75_12255 [Dickeya fangzhongdai]KHN52274.1 hypothetical protein OI70_19935 [Dickeya fangzhongdai]WPD75128.1 hypothetical protein OGM23_18695 [Dickeya fangzhongdai]